MGKIITKEINDKIKILIDSDDTTNYELAILILSGIKELPYVNAEQKVLQMLLKKVKYRSCMPHDWVNSFIKNKYFRHYYG